MKQKIEGGKKATKYNSKEEAALAYNNKAKELYGEFARLNIIKGL